MARIRTKECKIKEKYLKQTTLEDVIYNIVITKIRENNRNRD